MIDMTARPLLEAANKTQNVHMVIIDPDCGHCKRMMKKIEDNAGFSKTARVQVLSGKDDPMAWAAEDKHSPFPHCFEYHAKDVVSPRHYVGRCQWAECVMP